MPPRLNGQFNIKIVFKRTRKLECKLTNSFHYTVNSVLTIYKSDEAYTAEVKANKCICIHFVRVIFYQEENGQFGSTLTLLITTAFTLHVFLQNFFPTLQYVLI